MTQPIYETFVHMSQPFGMNVPIVDFHGNNGNVIVGDVPASDRYTECRLSKITERYILDGVEKNSVPMIPNYLEDEKWPSLLPSVFPTLLVNGSQGIGVSVSQTFVPHDLHETVKLITGYIKTGELIEDTYYPSFPTGGTIINKSELPTINKTGKGRIILQAKYKVQKNKIVFYEMPYQIYIENTIDEIRKGIDDEKITNVTDVYNNSDKTGIELVVVCSSAAKVDSVLNQLFSYTHLRSQYNANQNAIVSKTPVLLNLKQVVDYYIEFNLDCIRKENQYDLDKVQERLHIIDGLLIAIGDIDNVVHIIRKSDNPKEELKTKYDLDDAQSDAILGMRLSRLSHLESEKLEKERNDKSELAQQYRVAVNNEQYRKQILCNKLYKMDKEFGGKRKTDVIDQDIVKVSKSKTKEVYDVVIESVLMPGNNHVMRIRKTPAAQFKSSDNPHFTCKSNDLINIVDVYGDLFRVSAEDIKDDTGRGMVPSALGLAGNSVQLVLPNYVDKNEKRPYIIFGYNDGHVLKMEKSNLIGTTRNLRGKHLVKDGDSLVGTIESNGDVIRLETSNGYFLDFEAEKLRTSKGGHGRIGIKLRDGDEMTDIKRIGVRSYVQTLGGRGRTLDYLK